MGSLGWAVKLAAGFAILVGILIGPWVLALWVGVRALNPANSTLLGAAITAAACVIVALVSERRVRSDLRDSKAIGALGKDVAQAGTIVMGVRDPMLVLAVRKGLHGSSDVADRISAWLTPYLALAAVGLAPSWGWAYTLGLGAVSVWTLVRRTGASRDVDIKPSMLKSARWVTVAGSGVLAVAGWFAWSPLLRAAAHALAPHAATGPFTSLIHAAGLASASLAPAVAAALIVGGWVAGVSAGNVEVAIVRERHLLAGPLAKAVGVSDALLAELRWEVDQHGVGITVHGPLPAAAITNATSLELGLAEFLPDFMVGEATSNRILLVEVSPERLAARALLVDTGGMVTDVEDLSPAFVLPDGIEEFDMEEL